MKYKEKIVEKSSMNGEKKTKLGGKFNKKLCNNVKYNKNSKKIEK